MDIGVYGAVVGGHIDPLVDNGIVIQRFDTLRKEDVVNTLSGIDLFFGKGFGFAELSGKDANDNFYLENETVKTSTNHNGGINGGLTNGMPIIFNCAVKPTPSIGLPQKTIDFEKMENVEIQINGRHDPAIIRRMAVVVDTLTAIVIADLLTIRFGRDYLKK